MHRPIDISTLELNERARGTADLQLRIDEALKDAETPLERRAAIAEARNEWELRLHRHIR
jgi:hypothetical protein